MPEIQKVEPAVGYPPEKGCYLRGNDYSPVAVVVILRWIREETPPEIEHLVRVGVEGGAALSGTLQTENVGLEKIICNVVSNPNIRYVVVCGPESPGHLVGDAILALAANGIDERKRIIGAEARTPYLFNIPCEYVQRFRKQLTVINLVNEGSPEVLSQAVWSCYQEEPTAFRNYMLYDPGAYPAGPLSGKITWRVTQPERAQERRRTHPGRKAAGTRGTHTKGGQSKKATAGSRTALRAEEDRMMRILFLYIGNSCRSQMAEGWTWHLWPDRFEAESAGIVAAGLDPRAVDVMAEVGVDISRQRSKTLHEVMDDEFDAVATLCGSAQEHCPVFPQNTRMIHEGFDDPPTLAARAMTVEQALAHYRRVRDEIRTFVEKLPDVLLSGDA